MFSVDGSDADILIICTNFVFCPAFFFLTLHVTLPLDRFFCYLTIASYCSLPTWPGRPCKRDLWSQMASSG